GPPISKGQDAQRNVDDEQYCLHRQPGLNEGILLNDDGQEYCGDQKNCIDRVAEVTHRRRLGPAGGCKDSKAAQEEQAAAQRDCQNMKMAQGHVVVGHAAFSPVPEIALRHRLIRSQPYSDGSELDECEVVVGVFFVSRGDGAEVLEFVEEALDEVSVTIKKGTESRRVEASGHWFDARPGAAFLDRLTQSVGVVGAVSEQDVSLAQTVQHIERASAVMGLAGRELEGDGPPLGIDQGMDLGRQSTSRAPHASG